MNKYSQNENKAFINNEYSKYLQALLEMNHKNKCKNLVQRLLKINSENKAKRSNKYLIKN